MKLALIAAPVVALYSPTVLPPMPPAALATKRLWPDNASPKEFEPVDEVGVNHDSRGGVVFAYATKGGLARHRAARERFWA